MQHNCPLRNPQIAASSGNQLLEYIISALRSCTTLNLFMTLAPCLRLSVIVVVVAHTTSMTCKLCYATTFENIRDTDGRSREKGDRGIELFFLRPKRNCQQNRFQLFPRNKMLRKRQTYLATLLLGIAYNFVCSTLSY